MMFGTSDHNIEVGGCGGKQGNSVVSCGWLFFFEEPGMGGSINGGAPKIDGS